MMGSPIRSARISAEYPFPFSRLVKTILDNCGDCPERLWCAERLVGGPLAKLLPDALRCLPASYAGPISRHIAKFVRENCATCRAKEACAQYLARHIFRMSALDDGPQYQIAKLEVSYHLNRCTPCPYLDHCIQGALNRNRLSVVRIARNFVRMIMRCEKGAKAWLR